MRLTIICCACLLTSILLGQGQGADPHQTTPTLPDERASNQRMVTMIEQSLNLFYKEQSAYDNYSAIIDSLNYEPSDIPEFSEEVYCQRISDMNERSPLHLDCNEHSLETIKFFVNRRRGFARVVLGRSKLYFNLFEEKLVEYGLPIELKYLAVIESGLRPQVKSRAGALGLWQFMYRTGRMFGLKEDSYVDERMDPEKGTDAACRYLKKLHGIYDDWNLALAAYNAGPGNVNRAIRRSGNKRTYWEIRPFLPRETQGYVPNFIAACYLLTYHAEHNIVPMEAPISYYQLDTMCLKKGVHFESISTLLEIEEEEVKKYNPIFKRDYVPKSMPPYCISLPLEHIGKLVEEEETLYTYEYEKYVKIHEPKVPLQPAELVESEDDEHEMEETIPEPIVNTFQYHRVSRGESLGAIASRYRTTVSDIQRMNGLNSTKIFVGQRLKVKEQNARQEIDATTDPEITEKYYAVRSGDTFSRIAQRQKMTINQLRRLNPNINVRRLRIGQKIRVR